jgi:hypothetical protein
VGSRVGAWWSEKPRRPPSVYACELARARFWRDPRRRLIETYPDLDEAAPLLKLPEELAHALVLVLSRLPSGGREAFAQSFYRQRRCRPGLLPVQPRGRLAVAAAVALLVVDVAGDPLRSERVVDLLRGAAQGDDLTRTPAPALAELQKAIARVRFDLELEDPADARAAAALAVAEVLDPANDGVAMQEVLARAAWAAVESWEAPRVLAFLLEVDQVLVDAL